MGFEESALSRLRRYRGEADRSRELAREIEGVARRLSERLFGGLEHAAVLAREAGFEVEASNVGGFFALGVTVAPGMESRVEFGVLGGVAAETDEDLMHEELSRYSLDPSGYSGRVLGWSRAVDEGPCQTFAVYRDGVWKTKGLFVAKARGRVDDPDDVLNGFCLRILGRLIDLAATTGGVGRRWGDISGYGLARYADGEAAPTELRLP
ncbi:hypothetical protein GBA63_00110 [Rubrobacter tropicus]|uniref:Uncharacterized protein n=1 Tax=Rubrobacter tropicus TaxID=2653851 RepID=A0A6G8Q3X4_9ACTN|nr:hypothetical protein [Rubrobacter tropicus]QIN81194.1 hypothetical protein GBA63_00110 [Rubrobacter tropicus]